MRISDWSSDVCSSDLGLLRHAGLDRDRLVHHSDALPRVSVDAREDWVEAGASHANRAGGVAVARRVMAPSPGRIHNLEGDIAAPSEPGPVFRGAPGLVHQVGASGIDRKSTRLNSSQ